MTVLALKLLLAPLLVVASSLAGRRWGPQVAGILVVLPVVAGPILLILYLDHGFAAHARAATLGIVPLALFALVFGYLSRGHGWLVTLAVSWIVVLLLTSPSLRLTCLQASLWDSVCWHCMESVHCYAGWASRRRPLCQHLGDLPARGVATASGSAGDWVAARVGPALTGMLTPFPIALSVVCAFTTAQAGHAGALALLRGIVPGLDGFALFCFLVAITINEIGGAPAFGLATAAAVVFAIFLVATAPARAEERLP